MTWIQNLIKSILILVFVHCITQHQNANNLSNDNNSQQWLQSSAMTTKLSNEYQQRHIAAKPATNNKIAPTKSQIAFKNLDEKVWKFQTISASKDSKGCKAWKLERLERLKISRNFSFSCSKINIFGAKIQIFFKTRFYIFVFSSCCSFMLFLDFQKF